MQVGLPVCLPYCATSFIENGGTSNSCTLTQTSMFDLTVSQWSQDFRDYYDSVNEIVVQMGANPDYEDDDPTITNPQDGLKEFYFDGVNDCMVIKEASAGRGGLLLHHTLTVSIWIFSEATPSSEEALLSKVVKSRTTNSNKITFGLGPGDAQWMTMTEFDSSGNLQPYSINLTASPSPQFGSSWTLLTYQLEPTDSQNSTIRLYVNGGDQTGLTIQESSATWFDNLEAAGFIGCTCEYSSSTWNNAKFFKGYMYRLSIWNDIKTQSEIADFYTNSSYTHTLSCASVTQNEFESCAECDMTKDNSTGTIEWERAGCSQCYQGLCTQCEANLDDSCYACKDGAYLENNTCICYANFDSEHSCPECAATCTYCYGPYNYQCTECDTDGYKQPNGNEICLDICPYGYSNSAGVCTGSADTVAYKFDLIQHNWESGNVKLYSGLLEGDEPTKDPYTYYLRGQFFDGVNHICSFATATADRFNLHNQFTIEIWFLPQASDTQSLFAKSESNGTASLFNLYINSGEVRTSLRRYPDDKSEDGQIATYSLDVWNHIVVVVDFDQATNATTVTGYIKAVQSFTSTYTDFVFLDTATSEASLGASFGNGRQDQEHFNGYIYCINITTEALVTTDFDGDINLDATLWTCSISEYQDNNGTQSCPDCGASHINSWDGCRDDFDCNVCKNPLCLDCASFADVAVCPSCKSNTNIVNQDCECNSVTGYEDSTRTCTCSDECATCTVVNRYSCISCNTGYWAQPDASNLCLNFCPQGYIQDGSVCTFEQNERDTISYDTFANDGFPSKDRGHYFLNQCQAHTINGSILLNNSGTIDAFLRPISYDSGVTVFHATTNLSSGTNSEDLLVLELTSTGAMQMRIYPTDYSTITLTTVTDTATSGASIGPWMHLALTWKWDSSFGTRFVGYRNNATELSADQANAYLEYSTDYSNNWACETDTDSSGISSTVRYFNGFIYQVNIANYLITPSTLF